MNNLIELTTGPVSEIREFDCKIFPSFSAKYGIWECSLTFDCEYIPIYQLGDDGIYRYAFNIKRSEVLWNTLGFWTTKRWNQQRKDRELIESGWTCDMLRKTS